MLGLKLNHVSKRGPMTFVWTHVRERGDSHVFSYIFGSGAWWRHQMETFSALLALYAGNSPVPGEFPSQRPVTRSFQVFFDLCLNKRLSKQSWGWWLKTPSRSLWRQCNGLRSSLLRSYLAKNVTLVGWILGNKNVASKKLHLKIPFAKFQLFCCYIIVSIEYIVIGGKILSQEATIIKIWHDHKWDFTFI